MPWLVSCTQLIEVKPRLHEHQVQNPDSNLDHNLHGRGGLSPDLNPLCLRVNATSLDQDLDKNARVNGALVESATSHGPIRSGVHDDDVIAACLRAAA